MTDTDSSSEWIPIFMTRLVEDKRLQHHRGRGPGGQIGRHLLQPFLDELAREDEIRPGIEDHLDLRELAQ